MALGGGSFTNYNKIMPGAYINFVSGTNASGSVGDRGICAVAMELSWGKEGEFFTVSAEEFMKDSMKLFGYGVTSSEINPLRDLFMNASTVHIYRLGTGVKAKNVYGEALYAGKCGNSVAVKVSENIDDSSYFDVTTYFKSRKMDVQKVKSANELRDNDFVHWDTAATLTASGAVSMTGGSDATVKGADYQAFLDKAETVRFNTMAVATTDASVNSLVAAYTKRMREERGIKFQSVLYKCEADDIGVINVDTAAVGSKVSEASLVWFVAGAAAGCEINKSLTNMVYKGSFTPLKTYTQSQLEEGVEKGKFMFHVVDGEVRVLMDINSLVNTTSDTGEVFRDNQTVRIVDQIAYDDAKLFTKKYLGVMPNDEAGRLSLWNDIVEHRKSLERMRAIEGFRDEDVIVERGNSKTSVVITSKICPVNSMAQLYITTTLE
ncbi:MAG: phage tail sheath family protein [Clostridia bacterium]|nr:phage tail sheath family protein [Clostridia bacterium]